MMRRMVMIRLLPLIHYYEQCNGYWHVCLTTMCMWRYLLYLIRPLEFFLFVLNVSNMHNEGMTAGGDRLHDEGMTAGGDRLHDEGMTAGDDRLHDEEMTAEDDRLNDEKMTAGDDRLHDEG